MEIKLQEVIDTINQLKITKASLSGRKEQLISQLNTTILPEFEKLGVTVDNIDNTIKVEEEDSTKSYNQILELLSTVNKGI